MLLRTLAVLLSFGLLAAQVQDPGGDDRAIDRAIAAVTELRVPIHAQRNGSTPELWAVGRDYKVSFHDGFTFYPVLGDTAGENLPLTWHTVAVHAGGESLLGASEKPTHQHADWRYDYVFANFVESYDVQTNGVEQLFTFDKNPGKGDLVVTGRIGTELQAAPRSGHHGPLVFRDGAGRAILEYGAAIAIDANGVSRELETAFDGSEITLTVPGTWLRTAVFPIVIDPLTSSKLAVLYGPKMWRPDLTREGISNTSNVMLTFLRQHSRGDMDAYAYLLNEDFSSARIVYTNTSTSTYTQIQSAFVGTARRWVISYGEYRSLGTVNSKVYFHDRADMRINSGKVVTVSTDGSWPLCVGGARFGTRALQVRRKSLGYGRHELHANLIDASNRVVFGGLVKLWSYQGSQFTQGIGINSAAYDDRDGWLVTWMLGGTVQSFDSYTSGNWRSTGSPLWQDSRTIELGATSRNRPRIVDDSLSISAKRRVQINELKAGAAAFDPATAGRAAAAFRAFAARVRAIADRLVVEDRSVGLILAGQNEIQRVV